MYVRTKTTKNSPRKTVVIVESVRNGRSVSQRLVQYMGVAANDDELKKLLALAEVTIRNIEHEREARDPQKKLFADDELPDESNAFETTLGDEVSVKLNHLQNEETVVDGPMQVVERIFKELRFDAIFTDATRDMGDKTLLKQLIAGIIARPSSKLGMSDWLAKSCAIDVSSDRIYRFMDSLCKREDKIKRIVRSNSESLFPSVPSLMLFDVTTIYNESFTEDELRKNGYSKDNKFNETQTVLALATDPEGMPLWYELFPGNTWEGDTFQKFVDTWKGAEYSDCKGVVVADSAMFSTCCLDALKAKGLSYVVGARLKSLGKAMKEKILDVASYKDMPLNNSPFCYLVLKYDNKKGKKKTENSEEGGKQNLIITWSSRRDANDKKKRARLVRRLKKKLNTAGEIKASETKSNKGTFRYLKTVEGKDEPSYMLDEEKIAKDAAWDGLHGVITDMPASNEEDIRAILSHYHSLWRIEESFRIHKSGLKIRPIFHRKDDRIRAHIALIYLAYSCVRQIQLIIRQTTQTEMSVDAIRAALLGVTSTLIRDKSDGRLYRLPKKLSPEASKIYKSLKIHHSTRPTEITSLSKYRKRRRYLGEIQPDPNE